MENMQQVHVYFFGKVQGVGFRYHCSRHAMALSLKGWVRNLPDKRVELLVEGPSKEINSLLDRLDKQFEIISKDIAVRPFSREFADFEILRP